MSENNNKFERHGCIVCARIFTLLARYTPEDRFIDCSVTSPGGHRVLDEDHPLVACNTHTAEEIEAAYTRWRARLEYELDDQLEE